MTIKSISDIKFYYGMHDKNGCSIVTVNDDPLPIRHDIAHRADTFEWGGLGGGAQQLAIAILADALGEKEAKEYSDHFYLDVTTRLHEKCWGITNMGVHWWYENIADSKKH